MRKLAAVWLVVLGICGAGAGWAAEDAAAKGDKPREDKPAASEPRKFTSEHRLQSGGTDIAYTTTAEDVVL